MSVSIGESSGVMQNRWLIDSRGQLLAAALPEIARNSRADQQAYSVESQAVSVSTTGSQVGRLYLLNAATSILDMYIDSIEVGSDGTATARWILTSNPTTGTLISDATASTSENLEFTSSNAANVTAYRGDATATVTDGTQFMDMPILHYQKLDVPYILKPGNAISVGVFLTATAIINVKINFYLQGSLT